jgi:uncharacterized protein (TIGR02145 family)
VKHLYLFGLLIFLPFFGFSQGEFNNWYFGEHAGITFNSGSPVALTDCSTVFENNYATCTVSDSLGNLLFYSDGFRVFNRNHTIMPNGHDLCGPGDFASQIVFSVQSIQNKNLFFLFTIDIYYSNNYPHPNGLRYSIIDMQLDGGLGDIPSGQKNIPISTAQDACQTVTGTRHHNNRYAWVVTRKYLNTSYYASYLVNNTGLDTTAVLSNSLISINVTQPYGLPSYVSQSIKISPDGNKLITAYVGVSPYGGLMEVCNFNSQTGQITPLFLIPTTMENDAGFLEFSRNSKYIYACEKRQSNLAQIVQFDATKTDSLSFIQSKDTIATVWYGSGLQLGPDGKIYCAHEWAYLNVINNPSVQGLGCNYQEDAVDLLGLIGIFGFPQLLQRYYVYISHSGQCQGDPVSFSTTLFPPVDSLYWDFGDPVSGNLNFSNLPNPTHIYSSSGTYNVTLIVRHNDNRMDTAWQVVNIFSSPQPHLGPDQIICIGDSVTFDAGACSGCTYLWKDLGSGLTVGTSQTFRTGQAGTYAVTVTNSNNCKGSDTVQLTTTPVPSVTNNPLSKTICSGESTNIALTSSVPGANFHWTASLTSGNITGFSADSGLVINQILINSLSTPGIVTYHITPKVGSCIGTTVDFPVTVNVGDSVKVSISASNNNICAGTAVTFTATPTNPGTTPNYQWKVNGNNSGTNSTTFTYTPINADVVTCVLTSSLTVCITNNPATSNTIQMIVNPLNPVSITISPSANPVCSGTAVTYFASPVNGGFSPFYQWKVNGANVGTNGLTYTYTPINGDVVKCVLTSNILCPSGNPATSNTVTMIVNPNSPVSVSISASANPFCQGSAVTFTATPTNGGTSPSYQWKVNGINVGSNNTVYTYIPVSGDLVLCILTSNIACPTGNPATSNTITMIQNNNLLAGVSIVASSNPFCPGNSVTFTATPSNGGTNPTYQWKVNGVNAGTNSSTYSYNPANGDSVRCIMTSNLSCVTANPASSAKIIMSGTLAPIVTFTSCFDTITTVNAKPIKLKGGIPLGGTYSGPGVNSLTGIFTPATAGIGTKTITYTYTNAAMCSALAHTHIINYPLSIVNCGNPITDIRDNKVYPTVQIGSQCWLASNLNYGIILASSQDQRDNCVAEKYCYNDNPMNCTNLGGLYQWDELMLFDETPADQGFCPPGWHIPTENDWNTLFATYINNGFAGSPLKYSGYSGFNALLSGARHINRGWDFQGFATFFWSSTARNDNKAWAHGMNDVDPSVSAYPSSRVNAFSVRCLKN